MGEARTVIRPPLLWAVGTGSWCGAAEIRQQPEGKQPQDSNKTPFGGEKSHVFNLQVINLEYVLGGNERGEQVAEP